MDTFGIFLRGVGRGSVLPSTSPQNHNCFGIFCPTRAHKSARFRGFHETLRMDGYEWEYSSGDDEKPDVEYIWDDEEFDDFDDECLPGPDDVDCEMVDSWEE